MYPSHPYPSLFIVYFVAVELNREERKKKREILSLHVSLKLNWKQAVRFGYIRGQIRWGAFLRPSREASAWLLILTGGLFGVQGFWYSAPPAGVPRLGGCEWDLLPYLLLIAPWSPFPLSPPLPSYAIPTFLFGVWDGNVTWLYLQPAHL
jgi:hypothetical protein